MVRAEDFDDSFGDGADDSLDELVSVFLSKLLRLACSCLQRLIINQRSNRSRHRQLRYALMTSTTMTLVSNRLLCVERAVCSLKRNFLQAVTSLPSKELLKLSSVCPSDDNLKSSSAICQTVQLAPMFTRTNSKTAGSSHGVPLVTPKLARTTSSRSKVSSSFPSREQFVSCFLQRIPVEDPNADVGHIPKVIEYNGCPEDLDLEAAKEWVYPSNVEERLYQKTIIRSALLKNVLVSLPTGLGKTFIAAVVMYNFYRYAQPELSTLDLAFIVDGIPMVMCCSWRRHVRLLSSRLRPATICATLRKRTLPCSQVR